MGQKMPKPITVQPSSGWHGPRQPNSDVTYGIIGTTAVCYWCWASSI